MRTVLSILFIVGSAVISCDDDEPSISTKLQGTWIWQSTCGGFAGCVYPTSKNYKTLKITDTLLELNESGQITISGPYTINDVTGDDNSKTYEVELNDGEVWIVLIGNNILTIQGSPITSIYKRSK